MSDLARKLQGVIDAIEGRKDRLDRHRRAFLWM